SDPTSASTPRQGTPLAPPVSTASRPLSPSAPPSPPPQRAAPSAAPPPAPAGSWEEELRRLLGGDEPKSAPWPHSPSPIPPAAVSSRLPSRPWVVPRPAASARPATPRMAGPRIAAADKAVDVQLPALQESAVAYRRASHLHEDVAQHLKRVEQMTERHLVDVP